MPNATFKKDYDHRTTRGAIVAYKAGWSGDIPQAHVDGAKAADALEDEPKGGTAGKGG